MLSYAHAMAVAIREILGSHGSDYENALCSVIPRSLIKCNNISKQSTGSITW